LVGAEKIPMLHHQMAIVFELRRFTEYYEITQRILSDLNNAWSKSPNVNIKILLREIEITSKKINEKGLRRVGKHFIEWLQ
jgi:hypothetical protein